MKYLTSKLILFFIQYMAPEILRAASFDERSDIWSLGKFIREVHCMPEEDKDFMIQPYVSSKLKIIVKELMEPDVEFRPSAETSEIVNIHIQIFVYKITNFFWLLSMFEGALRLDYLKLEHQKT